MRVETSCATRTGSYRDVIFFSISMILPNVSIRVCSALAFFSIVLSSVSRIIFEGDRRVTQNMTGSRAYIVVIRVKLVI